MEHIVKSNNMYILTRFIRTLPHTYKCIKEYSYDIGIEQEKSLHDLFDELYYQCLLNINSDTFLDICAAPGTYSNYILEKNPNAHGVGISLCVSEGGCKFTAITHSSRYQQVEKNIFHIDLETYDPKYDFSIASCIPYNISAKSSDQYKIIYKSLLICLNSLKEHGTLLINFSFKNMFFAINFIYLIQHLFKKIKLFKSTKLWILQRTFYVIGYDFHRNEKYVNEIEKNFNDFETFYANYYDKLLPNIDRKSLDRIMKQFERSVFMPQIKSYLHWMSDMIDTNECSE